MATIPFYSESLGIDRKYKMMALCIARDKEDGEGGGGGGVSANDIKKYQALHLQVVSNLDLYVLPNMQPNLQRSVSRILFSFVLFSK